ncbi:MAG: methyltransferase domain-containing protein [Armatimonadetes bacterium]|nr:methyltransferase domain-containing protein [Armatimonadota bacterium]
MQAEEYAKMRALEDRYWWFVSRRRLAHGLMRRYGRTGAKVLDLGCGTGAMLSELNEDAVGVDFSPQALQFSHQRGLEGLVNGNAEALPFRDATFDVIVSLDTLEHVENHQAAAGEIARVLSSNGVAVINVPAYKWLWGPHDVALMHYRRYTRRQLSRLMAEAGLEVDKASYSVFFLFPVVVVLRLLERMRQGPAEVRLPAVPGVLNRFLVGLQDVEASLIRWGSLPWGSSVVIVARKP